MRSRKKRKDDSCRILKVDNRSLRFYVCRSLVRVFGEAGLYMYLSFIYVLFFLSVSSWRRCCGLGFLFIFECFFKMKRNSGTGGAVHITIYAHRE